jgi:hypothetical protein
LSPRRRDASCLATEDGVTELSVTGAELPDKLESISYQPYTNPMEDYAAPEYNGMLYNLPLDMYSAGKALEAMLKVSNANFWVFYFPIQA